MRVIQELLNQHKTVLVFSFASLIFFVFYLLADGVSGGGDTYTHYFMAKYAGKHQELFLNQWGKPVFTTIFFPIAQFGLSAVILVNLIFIFIQAAVLLQIAKKLGFSNLWLVPFLFFTTPVVFENSISALTEILFGLLVICFIYLSVSKQIVLPLFLISWLPFVRSEGFIFVLIIAVYYVINKKWKYLPILLSGTIVMNSIGWYVSGEPLWLFASNPYVNTAITAYGKGSLLHFFLWGIPVFGLGFLILLFQTVHVIRSEKFVLNAMQSEFLNWKGIRIWFVYGFFWSFFAAHVFLWWQGMWASLGLTRVMFCIVGPFVLIIYEYIHPKLLLKGSAKRWKWVAICAVLSPFLASSMVLEWFGFPTGFGTEERIINQAVSEMRITDELKPQEKVYFAHPYFAVALNRDPFDANEVLRIEYYNGSKSGEWIIWDGHFAPNEHNTALSSLMNDSLLIPVGVFFPQKDYRPLNNIPFEIHVFRRK
jgi:hypothetical protein